jgi:hypothetical protein
VNLALRPYVTTGIAIIGASVIAVAPIVPTPTEIQIPNPAVQLDRGVRLAANEIQDGVNALAFAGANVLVSLAKLPAPVVAQLLGIPVPAAQLLLAGGALGLSGPLIGGIGAGGAAIQDVVNQLGSFDLAALINSLIGAPATLIDGVVNGGFGPNLASLLGLPAEFVTLLAGGLINPGNLNPLLGDLILPGAIPTLQGLITQLLSAFGGADMVSALAAPVESEGQIEGAVNFLVFNLVASPIVTIAGLLGQVLAPVLGEEQAAMLPLAALGLLGPLISGPGAVGTAIQDVVDSLGSGDFAGILSTLIGAPATIIGGVVNGGSGPSLTPLVGDLLFPLVPPQYRPAVLAGGLVNGVDMIPPIVLPGVFPTLQKLVGQILGLLPSAPAALTGGTTLSLAKVTSTDTTNQRLVNIDLSKDDVTPDLGEDVGGNGATTLDGKPAALDGKPAALDGKPAALDGKPAALDTKPGVVGNTPPGAVAGVTPASPNGAIDMTGGSKFEPEVVTPKGGNSHKGSNPIGSAISGIAKSFGSAVKSALGG